MKIINQTKNMHLKLVTNNFTAYGESQSIAKIFVIKSNNPVI